MPRCISQNYLQSFPASGCFPASFPIPTAGYCPPTPPQETFKHSQVGLTQSPVGPRLLSPGSWCAQGFVCALQEWSGVFPPVQWKSYNQILLGFKVRFPGDSRSLLRITRLGRFWSSRRRRWTHVFLLCHLEPISSCYIFLRWGCLPIIP